MGTKTLRDQRRALLWWSLGFVFTVFMYTAFWPNVHANAAQFNQYLEKLPEAIKNALGGASFGSPEGYVQTEVFSLLGPVLLLVYAIGAGTRAIAGEAEGRTLDLLLSTPLSRRRLVMEKFGAMAAATLFLAILMALSLEAIGPLYDLGLPLHRLIAATLNLFLIALAFGTFPLVVGTVTGSKGAAVGVSGGVAVVTVRPEHTRPISRCAEAHAIPVSFPLLLRPPAPNQWLQRGRHPGVIRHLRDRVDGRARSLRTARSGSLRA